MPISVPQLEYPPRKVSWLKRDVLLFAASIGCSARELHFLHELHPNFQVFPTYPIVLTFKYDHPSTIDFLSENAARPLPPGCPSLDWSRAVDGRRRITVYRPLPPTSGGDGSWEMRSKVLAVYDKGRGRGTVLEMEHVLVHAATGEAYSRAWESAFFVGTGGWGGERGPSIKRIPPPAREPDAVSEFRTTAETAHLYRLNGDYNPLHASPPAGRALGYDGIILHGLFGWNVAAQTALRHYGRSHGANLRDFEARFVAPVRPGDALSIRMWDMGEFTGQPGEVGDALGGARSECERLREVRLEVRVADKVVLGDGRALIVMEKDETASKL
ncbi:hypothetical protein VTO42DRAFT_1720 [Malbranchea cinnamomea]